MVSPELVTRVLEQDILTYLGRDSGSGEVTKDFL